MATQQKILDVNVPRQAQDNWCWAAVSVGIRRAYEGSATLQCQVATQVLGQHPCCPAGVETFCNVQRPLVPALRPHFDGPVLDDGNSRQFEFVKHHIDRGHPLAVRLAWGEGGTGHFVVISGYHETGDLKDVVVCDPYIGGKGHRVPFEQFRSNYQQLGQWDLTYRTAPDDGAAVAEVTQ